MIFTATGSVGAANPDPRVRPAHMAGSWYPGDPEVLSKQVDELLARASPPGVTGKPLAVISPHAGYRYSAPVAAAAYCCLKDNTYKRVIVLAFSHSMSGSYDGVDVPGELIAYETPLGRVPIDREVGDRLLQKGVFASHPDVDRGEWSLELQLPLLQRVLKDFQLVPLLVGLMSDRAYVEAAEAIIPFLDDNTLLVASSDFTHFGPRFGYQPFTDDVPAGIRNLADRAAAPILRADYDGFVNHLAKTGDTICGRGPIALLLRILSMQEGAVGVRTAFDTSGNLTGDWSSSVTYQSFVLTRCERTLADESRRELLRVARQTVTAQIKGQKLPVVDAGSLPEAVQIDGACFVTLENKGGLRGCIGNMSAYGPLYEAVIHNAVSACQDCRFVSNPVTVDELAELHIEISLLTPMKRVDNVEEIVVGRHGLLISMGGKRGVLLPQVAARRGWTREEFLAQTCRKAGLPLEAWKGTGAQIESFEAEVFAE